MFGFFKKSSISLNSIPDNWEVSEGEYEGKPIFLRARLVGDLVGSKELPFQIGVAVGLKSPTESGFPQGIEFEELNKIEDKLDEVFLTDGAIFVMAITTDGMREFVYYAPEWKPEYFETKAKSVQEELGSHKLNFMMKHDPEWSTYTSFKP